MKKLATTITLVIGVSVASTACPFCNKKVLDGIYDSQFYPNLLTILSGFIVLAIIVAVLTKLSSKKYSSYCTSNPHVTPLSPVPLTTTAIILGIGLGGFVDGILFHQLLQVHEILSHKIPTTDYIGKSVNMFWDGIFHLFCLLVVIFGIIRLWSLHFKKYVDFSWKLIVGGLLMGWGLFNIVEGVINHHIIKLHNVIELSNNHEIGNFLFLGFSLLLIIVGYAVTKANVNKLEIRKAESM